MLQPAAKSNEKTYSLFLVARASAARGHVEPPRAWLEPGRGKVAPRRGERVILAWHDIVGT